MIVKLHAYQLAAAMRLKRGNVLCGGVGSGKSITALGWYYLLNRGSALYLSGGEYVPMENPSDLYIITTARQRDTGEWDAELAKYLMSRDNSLGPYSHKIVIDSWNNIAKYVDVQNAVFIFDEHVDTAVGDAGRHMERLYSSVRGKRLLYKSFPVREIACGVLAVYEIPEDRKVSGRKEAQILSGSNPCAHGLSADNRATSQRYFHKV